MGVHGGQRIISGNYGVYHGAVHKNGFETNGKIALSPNSDNEIDDTYVDSYHTRAPAPLIVSDAGVSLLYIQLHTEALTFVLLASR